MTQSIDRSAKEIELYWIYPIYSSYKYVAAKLADENVARGSRNEVSGRPAVEA